ncbi:MAG: rhodanese-like domain-containing protein [Arenicellales bacterium]|nr:rhodanese-like domain-containing protein [Arenicellales bacterium]
MPKTLADLVKDAKSRIQEISAEQLHDSLENNVAQLIVDVREPNEHLMWRIAGSMSIPRGILEPSVDLENPNRNKVLANARDEAVILYCSTGGRSALAADVLQTMGFTNVKSLAGGLTNWRNMGFHTEQS